MAKKRVFRKVHLICKDNSIFDGDKFEMVNMYRRAEYANKVCAGQQQLAIDNAKMEWNKGNPVPILSMHGFYLVHESLYDEILAPYAK